MPNIWSLPSSGYFRLDLEEASIIGDVGKIGPDYIPGHAHADTLSFEMSVYDRRLIVNSGISEYGDSVERLRQRGTAAHSTVIIDETNSSEVWGGFRVARRARPFGLQINEKEQFINCSHDGYSIITGKPIHSRTWHYEERRLQVIDRINGGFNSVEARFHIHPIWKMRTER